jgi:hypothetical protein
MKILNDRQKSFITLAPQAARNRCASDYTEAIEKIRTDKWSLEIKKIFNVSFTRFKNNLILLNKISQSFLATTKTFNGRVIPNPVKSIASFHQRV